MVVRALATNSSVKRAIATHFLRLRWNRCFDIFARSSSTTGTGNVVEILEKVRAGSLSTNEAAKLLDQSSGLERIISVTDDSTETLESFANLDHRRALRAGFPEAVFAENKTARQVKEILDDMGKNYDRSSSSPILATRVTPSMYKEICDHDFQFGEATYHSKAQILSVMPFAAKGTEGRLSRIVVATAGTTDIPVAEEAAVTLEASRCDVDRIFDVGVAGLHRIIKALPRLRHPDVRCVIVCAGMDGALPSVVGGLVSVPVIAVPTSVGYGASFGGISAMLTMMNSCSPGVGVVNIDNGFGAAALAYKCALLNRPPI